MKTEYWVIVSVVLLGVGIGWLASYWNGSMAFNAAYPLAGSTFVFNVKNTGSSALFGVLFTVLGALLLLLTLVGAIVRVASERK